MPMQKDLIRTVSNPVCLSSKAKTEERRMLRMVVNILFPPDQSSLDVKDDSRYIIPSGPKCFGFQGFRHMKQECPTYLKSIGKSKALAAILSDTESRLSQMTVMTREF